MAATKKKVTRKVAAKPKAAGRRAMQAKRELIDTGTNKLFVGRSLAADRRQHSKRKAKPGQGDRGDR